MTTGNQSNLWHLTATPVEVSVTGEEVTTDPFDLLIIGGGFTGCSAALEAAKRGAKVLLLEAKTIGFGGSGRNVGLVNAGLWLPPNVICKQMGSEAGTALINALSVAPQTVFDLIAEEEIECEAERQGTLHLAHNATGLAELQNRFRQGNQFGAPLRLLDAAETGRRTGSEAFEGAIFDPRAGTIQPLSFCRGLAAAAHRAGAVIAEHSPVEALHQDTDGWHAVVRGRRFKAKHLLLATNAYALGPEGAPKPAFSLVSYSQFATAPLPPVIRQEILPGKEGCWDTAPVMTSVRMDRAGRLIVGGVGNAQGAAAPVHTAWARRKLAALYPKLGGIPFEQVWSGQIAMTQDHIPKIVAFGPDALSVFGYSGRGIGPGTVFGRAAALALLTGDSAGLPIQHRPRYRERLTGVRSFAFEAGVAASHALSARRWGPR